MFEAERIPEFCLLERKNVVFKQLYEINEKYSGLLEDMKDSYVVNVAGIVARYGRGEEGDGEGREDGAEGENGEREGKKGKKKHHVFVEYNSTINEKLDNLNYLINKMAIMGNNLLQNIENSQIPVLVNEYE